jgi:hypothetical protein
VWTDVCIDTDGDGYGFQCALGVDCDDEAADVHEDCASSCNKPAEGCSCDETSKPRDCTLPYELSSEGDLLCSTGTRYCRDGAWSACEGIKTFSVPAAAALARRALLNPDAGVIVCSPCRPDCYRVEDGISAPVDGMGGGLASAVGGGVTLALEADDAGVPDAGLLDDVQCTHGVAPDVDCDGIPDAYDPYPSAAPFATDHQTIFMDLAAGETASQAFDVRFYVNTADVYFYLDMTASMEGERDKLIASLTSGNYLPNAGAGIECADRDFNGMPDNQLKNAGIAGNIACLIRDSRLGAGWFRDIPFEGPFANGIRVAPTDFEMFEHRQDITGDINLVRDALGAFETRGNYNVPEGSMQGLWSLVTGQGLYAGWTRPGVPTRAGCPAGTWGYPCFRDEAVPIILHITDAPLQNGPTPTTASRTGYLTDCVEECACVRESCYWGFCWCAEEACSCGNRGRNPLDYDSSVLAGMSRGSEPAYRSISAPAETLATAEDVGTIDDMLITYAGTTQALRSDLRYATTGSCPSGKTAWSSSNESGRNAVFRFRVLGTKTLTLSTRGSRFDTALMVKKVGSAPVLDCNNDLSSSDSHSEITRSFSAGEYYAIVKGRTGSASGIFQLTLGDKNKQTSGSFAAKSWLGPAADGTGGVREALLSRGVRVISVNSSNDAYLREQARVLSTATGAQDAAGSPLTFTINSDGTGMGSAVIDAVNLLAGNLSMDVGVVLREAPDVPSPRFLLQVEAVDTAGDLCDPPVDRDGDAAHVPDTHLNCRPGAAPQFRVAFTNPAAPHNVPLNPNDPRGGYNMRLELIGDDTYVVDRIPVYLIPEDVIADPATPRYASTASYVQDLEAVACTGNEAPNWSTLSFRADVPGLTGLRWELCGADSEARLDRCTYVLAAETQTGGACATDSDCALGRCTDGRCRHWRGPTCSRDQDCGGAGQCEESVCVWNDAPMAVGAALRPGYQGRKYMRVRATLLADEDRRNAPTLYDWSLDYVCSEQE